MSANAPAMNMALDMPGWRSRALLVLLLLGFGVLIARAVYLQGLNNHFLQKKGDARYGRMIELPATRGMITDRNREPLAISTPVESVWASPADVEISQAQMKRLSQLIELDPGELKKRFAETERDFVYLKRHLPPDQAAKIVELNVPGIFLQREYRRYYPGSDYFAHLIGFTDIDDQGQEALELAFDSQLAGKPGSRRVIKDRLGRIVEDVESARLPQEGRDLTLSVDARIQYLAYRELKNAVDTHHAKAGSIVVLDAQTGEVLAMANLPSYNPNNRGKLEPRRTRNRAVTDLFEPGSTLKPFTVAAALESGKYTPDTIIQTGSGQLVIGSAIVHDAHPDGALTVAQVIQKSSNVGAAKIALSMAAEQMWDIFSKVGFGTQPRSGFPGEVAGKLRAYATWRPIEQATMAYGHGLSLSLLQLARAYLIFSSDGEIKPVTVVKLETPAAATRVISAKTALQVRRMLELVVQPGGTAPRAQITGYRVAGKTGTAHKLDGATYAPNKYVSSFIGFAPASAPRLIVAVMIDEPGGGQYYGGTVAAPAFSKVMAGALRLLGVKPDAPLNNVVLPPPDAPEVREEVMRNAAIARLGIQRLATDSRRVRRGDTFVAYPGETQDGRSYIAQAIARGAASVLWEKRGFRWRPDWRVPNAGITQLRSNAGLIASGINGDPSARLLMIGVTGTNGKTTCSQWIAQALDYCGVRSAVIGTLGYGMRRTLHPLLNTTPDAVWLHAQLADFLRRGARAVSMEVSSIGLDQDRVAGVEFDAALFTNLTRDHLDYHRTMARYRRAKLRLFECASLKHAIVNLDDEFGTEVIERARRRGLRVLGYGFAERGKNLRRLQCVAGSNLVAGARGVRFDVATPAERATIESPMLGRHNASNLLGTLATLLASGVKLKDAAAALGKLRPVAGRMQKLGGGRRPLVVVDYAHTPDALEHALRSLREIIAKQSAIVCVFGCGGDRDRGKRPLMGAVATRLADRVVITSDNPRSEQPLKVIADIGRGARGDYVIEPDRRRAIVHALRTARRGDVVLIAGKGHENYQEIAGVRRPFSDVNVARTALQRWAA